MITVYGFGKVTPLVEGITRDLRALWALEECELAYQVRGLDDFAGELHQPAYLSINPFGQVPAIEHDGLVIFESGAIVAYLANQSEKLLPANAAEQAHALQWSFSALDTVEPAMTQIAAMDLFEPDAGWVKARRPALVKMANDRLAVLEQVFADKDYLLGDRFTYPDILMAAALCQIQHTDLLKAFPSVTAYRSRCLARSAWRRCLDAYHQRLAA
ncbi:glutathione S-transferase family protein [Alcanivorax sp. JB21]|uniref:glutathione S-transferase family protein n=1 Tax=Alcanivorax limicola TaxID=2874102 RepID=UPI001CC0AAB7|nr:glutathione S-transferase family protein [Alcanivorax limicola]MBZ2188816.1 glutathione S-transferase family protein [Alcanivorax limicola]